MQRINYHHLYYFWTVVNTGGIARASEKLYLTQPTISAQIAQFEQTMVTRFLKEQAEVCF
jgi:LysR family transcriptional activator of nhaA